MFSIEGRNVAQIGPIEFHRGPGIKVICDIDPGEKFYAIRGLLVQLPNGFELSIQWGAGNYCDARDVVRTLRSETAEVAICSPTEVLGDVSGWMTATEVLALIPVVAGLAPNTEITTPANMLTTALAAATN